MSQIRLYLDEDVMAHSLLTALKTHNIDVTTVLEQCKEGLSDEEQLNWAATQDRVICTGNVADFVQLHRQYLAQGIPHAGILIIPQQKYSIGDYLRAIIKFVNKYTAVNVRNQIYFLSNLL